MMTIAPGALGDADWNDGAQKTGESVVSRVSNGPKTLSIRLVIGVGTFSESLTKLRILMPTF